MCLQDTCASVWAKKLAGGENMQFNGDVLVLGCAELAMLPDLPMDVQRSLSVVLQLFRSATGERAQALTEGDYFRCSRPTLLGCNMLCKERWLIMCLMTGRVCTIIAKMPMKHDICRRVCQEHTDRVSAPPQSHSRPAST